MTDFYSVLQTALSRVGAVDETARERIYGHVREVMIRKLQDLDPPLDEEQIASRLSTFDAAIERIEADVVQRQSAGDADAYEVDDEPAEDEPQAEEPQASAYADGENEYARAEAGWERDDEDEASTDASDEPAIESGWGNPSIDALREPSRPSWSDGEDDRTEPRFTTGNGAAGGGERYRAPSSNGYDRAASGWDRTADRQYKPRAAGAVRDESYWSVEGEAQPAYAEAAGTERTEPSGWAAKLRPRGFFAKSARAGNADPTDLDSATAPPRQANGDGQFPRRSREPSDGDPIAALARGLRGRAGQRAEPSLNEPPADAEPVPYQMEAGDIAPAADDFGEPIPATRKSRRAMKREAKEERRAQRKLSSNGRRLWILAILLVGAVIIGWAASVFIPILFPAGPEVEETGTEAAAELPPAPANAGPVTPVRTVTPETAAGPIMLFQGADPSVFEAAPDNPVQYEGDAETGLTRITSSITSGGARAVLGPGIVESIAGHSVRIVLEARGTPGQAAATVNLGYQHGDTQLQTRAANLPVEFGAVAATWAIPAGATAGDYLLIDPGVPGDGTAIDIRSIRIEIIN